MAKRKRKAKRNPVDELLQAFTEEAPTENELLLIDVEISYKHYQECLCRASDDLDQLASAVKEYRESWERLGASVEGRPTQPNDYVEDGFAAALNPHAPQAA